MKTSRLKSIQTEQYQYSLNNPSVEYHAYALAGYSLGTVLRAPRDSSLRNFGSNRHPHWIDLTEYGPAVPYPVHGRYTTSDGFGQIMDSMTCKDANLAENGDDAYSNPDAFTGQHDGFAHTYFPVVFRISPVHLKTTGIITNDEERITVIPFRVVASTWPWVSNGPNVDYDPVYRLEQFVRNGVRIDLHLDYRFIELDNEDSYYSMLSAVLSVLPYRWAKSISADNVLQVYLTIAPAISEEHYADHIDACQRIMQANAPRGDKCFSFGGASLGLAVLAAIMGMPPIMYTGYNSQMGTNAIISEERIQEVALGANMVENVEDIEYKTAAAIIMGVPIIIPMNISWYKEPAQQALQRGVARALGQDNGRRTLLALAAKQFGYPANMTRAIALSNDSTNWALNMQEFIYTTAKRAAGWNFNELPSLILAATNLSDVQILAAHAVAYMWNPTGSVLVKHTSNGAIAGRDESQKLAERKHRTRRAEELAIQVGSPGQVMPGRIPRRVALLKQQIQKDTKDSNMWDTDKIEVDIRQYDDSEDDDDYDPVIKRKPAAKKAGGKASGKIKARGKAAGGKKKAPAKKKAAKQKPKKKASSAKKKGGKKKSGGTKKGKKKKKPAGGASGSIVASYTAALKKKKKKGKKKGKKGKGKKRPIGKASSIKKAKKSKKSKTGKKKKSKSKKSHKKKTKLGRASGYRVLGTARRSAASHLSAKQIMQRALAKARAGKK